MFRTTLSAIAFSALMLGSAQALTIDAFEELNQTVTDTATAGSTVGTQTGASIIGGVRRVEVLQTGGSSDAEININQPSIAQPLGNSLLTLSNADGTSASSLLYNAGGTGLGAGLGVDATESGAQNAFDLRIILNDIPLEIGITVGSADGESTLTQTTTGLIFSSTPFTFEYADFGISAAAGADFDELTFIRIDITTNFTATDLQLDFFGTTNTEIPEPTALAIMGLGLIGLGFARRRRR